MKIGIDLEQSKKFEEMLRNAIKSGELLPGQRMMSLEQLSKQFHVGRIEVGIALRNLKKDKLIISFGSKGTYVLGVKPVISLKKTVCVITAGAPSSLNQKVTNGIENILTVNGYDTLIKNTGNSQTMEEKLLRSMINGNAAGFIIEPSRSQLLCKHTELYEKMEELNIPYVFIRSTYPQFTGKPRIIVDDSQGGYMLTRHMIATIGENIVGIFMADDNRGAERHRGYVKALQEAGIPYRPEYVIWYHIEERMEKPTIALEEILKERQCDGIICYDDAMATNILYYLFQKGYSVPDDIAVAGYGNTAVATAGELGLTTIAQPDELLGEMAAEYLLDMINGDGEKDRSLTKVLSPELVIRGSTIGNGI